MSAVEEAVRLSEMQETVALVNGASVQRPGGLFFSGGKHSSEESLCVMSSFFYSLRRAEQMAVSRVYLPDDGVVVSPTVEFFRHGVRTGYSFREDVLVLAAIISIGMLQDGSHLTNQREAPQSSLEGHCDVDVLSRFRSIFVAARGIGVDVVVFPDLGCGIHQGDPVAIGRILGIVVNEFDGVFREIVFCGTTEFADHAMEHIDAGIATI